jgi:Arc/MetJ family transcription regulator
MRRLGKRMKLHKKRRATYLDKRREAINDMWRKLVRANERARENG